MKRNVRALQFLTEGLDVFFVGLPGNQVISDESVNIKTLTLNGLEKLKSPLHIAPVIGRISVHSWKIFRLRRVKKFYRYVYLMINALHFFVFLPRFWFPGKPLVSTTCQRVFELPNNVLSLPRFIRVSTLEIQCQLQGKLKNGWKQTTDEISVSISHDNG